MTDESRKTPPLPVRVTRDIREPTDEEVYVPPSVHERLPPPPPRPLLINGRQPSYIEFSAQLKEFKGQMEAITVASANTLATQRKMALQLDGFQSALNGRFDIFQSALNGRFDSFHQEFALLRGTVTGDHAHRITAVEKNAAAKAKLLLLLGGKVGGLAVGGAFVLRVVGKAYPQFTELIEGVLGALGL